MARGMKKTITGGNLLNCPSQASLFMVLLKMPSNQHGIKDKTELGVIPNG